MADTLRLEGFAESLRGHRVYCVAGQAKEAETLLKGRVVGLDAEVAHRGRKVLVVQGAPAAPKWLLGLTAWDAMFHVRDVADLKMVVTYLQHATRPTRVVWAGGEPQAAVLAALVRMDGVTVVGLGERAPVSDVWQAILWAPSAALEDVEPAVGLRMGVGATSSLRSVLRELAASAVGLVWSCIGESDKRGGLYWLDPGEGVEAAPLDLREAAETLRAVADAIGAGRL